jgi:hypothetical protein
VLQDQEASLHGLLVEEGEVLMAVHQNLMVVMVVVEKVLIRVILHHYQFFKVDLVYLELVEEEDQVQMAVIMMLEVVVVVLLLLDIKLRLFLLKKQLVVLSVTMVERLFMSLQVLALLKQQQIGHQQP